MIASSVLIRLARAYIRYFPVAAGKRWLWSTVIGPHLAWEPHYYVARTAFGARMAGDASDIIQQYIYYFGVWEPHLTRWLSCRLRPGDVFVDVGANVGYFSLLAAKRVGSSGSVVAVEASPAVFERLRKNLALNGAVNVRPVNAAAADRRGAARVYLGSASNSGLTTTIAAVGGDFECEVEAAPLSELLRPSEVQAARVIKIDVEGAEAAVVAGLAVLLPTARRDLEVVVEINPDFLARQDRHADEIFDVFRSAGFHAYGLVNDYSALSYLPPCPRRRPVRLRQPLDCETDVVFSRLDAEEL